MTRICLELGLGTIEEVGEVQFVKGQKYEIRVEYTNVPLPVSRCLPW